MEVNNNVMNNGRDANESHILAFAMNAMKRVQGTGRTGHQPTEQQQPETCYVQPLSLPLSSSSPPPRQQANARERCRTHRYATDIPNYSSIRWMIGRSHQSIEREKKLKKKKNAHTIFLFLLLLHTVPQQITLFRPSDDNARAFAVFVMQ